MKPSPHPNSEAHFNHFSSQVQNLYKHVEEMIFPRRKNWLAWQNEPPPNAPHWQQWLLKLTTNPSVNYIWFFLSILALFILESALRNQGVLIGVGLFLIFALLILCLCFLSYGRFLVLLRHDTRYTRRFHLSIQIFIALAAALLVTLVANLTSSSPTPIWFWLLFWLLLSIPAVTFSFLVLAYILIRTTILLGYVLSYFDPSLEPISRRLFFPFPRQPSQPTAFDRNWFLGLTQDEFDLLQTLTELNLANAEKRLIPVGIVFAFAGIAVDAFGNTAAFHAVEEWLMEGLIYPTTAWPIIISVGFFLAFVSEFVSILATLLGRMTTCGLILETCSWAKYERSQHRPPEEPELLMLSLSQPQKPSFRQWLTQKLPFTLS
jgi:hypothetical protein